MPEILRHGRTAYVADDLGGMVAGIDRVGDLDPEELRRDVERRFSVERMVDGYLQVYEAVAGTAGVLSARSAA